jgi:hypothetical protein
LPADLERSAFEEPEEHHYASDIHAAVEATGPEQAAKAQAVVPSPSEDQ